MCPVGVVVRTRCGGRPGRAGGGPRIDGGRGPAGRSLAWLQRLAQPLAVGGTRGSAGTVGNHVVGVPDRGVAPGGTAGLVADGEEPAQLAVEDPAAGVQRDELVPVGAGEQPAQGQQRTAPPVASHASAQSARRRRANAAGTGCPPGSMAGSSPLTDERLGGHDELDLDRHRGGGDLTGDAFDEGVGHDLPGSAPVRCGAVTGGAGGADRGLQGGVDGHALLDGQQRGQVGHGVRGRAQRDPPVGAGLRGPLDHRRRVEPDGEGLGPRLDLPVTQRGQVIGEGGIDRGAVLHAQARRLTAHDRGAPLADPASGQVTHRVRQLVDQRLRQPEVPRATRRRLPPGERDLRGDPPPAVPGRNAGRGLGLALGGVERHRHDAWAPAQACLIDSSNPELVDPLGVRDAGVQRGQPSDAATARRAHAGGPLGVTVTPRSVQWRTTERLRISCHQVPLTLVIEHGNNTRRGV